jgi:hypothetical protein
MQRHPLHIILGRPALHLLLALAFVGAFAWPIFVMTRPTETFHFLYAAWIVALGALFAVSRGTPVDSPSALSEAEGVSEADDTGNTEERF